jgi:asparagine synthase (glutamine-hydrolysing)
MCGISGVFGLRDVETVKKMLDSLIHRGPDDGQWTAGEDYVLGARRLSIVDVEGGRQPLANEAQNIWAVQNGEIYNFPDVRKSLLSEGYRFKTRCDTEVIPILYEKHGTAFAEHLDGMFATALWDTRTQTGILARDRMGKKPLYYCLHNNALYFASEIKAILCIPGFKRELNLEALDYYLSYKHVPGPQSIFRGIHSLPPAHILIFREGSPPKIERYWDLDFSPGETATWSEDEITDHIIELLRKGVKRRLMSDVPIGFFLSGGIDSSLSTALAAELSADPIKTFTLTYAENSTHDGKEQDRYWASWVAEKYKTDHHEEIARYSDFPENLRRILKCFDEPFCGTVSTYYLSGLISRHVKVALSGDGADELFGSYLSHRLAFPIARFSDYAKSGDANLIRPFESQPEFVKQMAEPNDWTWKSKLFVYSDAEKKELYSPELRIVLDKVSAQEHLRSEFSQLTAADPLNRVLEAEYRSIFCDQVLTFIDRLSMAHSLEVRSAFLDTELVSFVAKLPGSLKMKDGVSKYLLKKAALKYFPGDMVYRKKEGFVMPITDWLLRDLEDYVRATLSHQSLNRHGLFDSGKVQTLVDKLYDGSNHDYRFVNKILSLLVFQEWHDLYLSPVHSMAR